MSTRVGPDDPVSFPVLDGTVELNLFCVLNVLMIIKKAVLLSFCHTIPKLSINFAQKIFKLWLP